LGSTKGKVWAMTYYLVCPANRETALRNLYAARGVRSPTDMPDEDEQIGVMVREVSVALGGQGRIITGTSRANSNDMIALLAVAAPWLEIVEEWPSDWLFQPEEGE